MQLDAAIIIEDFSVNVIFLIMLFRFRRKEVVKENSFWNNADTTSNRYVDVGI
jgi:hypothetical protein